MPESMMDAGTVPWDAEKTKKDNFSNVFSYHIYLKNKAKPKAFLLDCKGVLSRLMSVKCMDGCGEQPCRRLLNYCLGNTSTLGSKLTQATIRKQGGWFCF